jgi:hypothetical protein
MMMLFLESEQFCKGCMINDKKSKFIHKKCSEPLNLREQENYNKNKYTKTKEQTHQ